MGLTAYGHTEKEALDELIKLFNFDIHYHRKKGVLEAHLDNLGVDWSYDNEYEGDFIDTNELTGGTITSSNSSRRWAPVLKAEFDSFSEASHAYGVAA